MADFHAPSPRDDARRPATISMRTDGTVEVRSSQATVSGMPDHTTSAAWRRALRRIDRVVLDADPLADSAIIVGVGHRRPVRRRVTLSTGLGLAAAGVPATVATSAHRRA
ncbi:MAG: hypothetical protein ACE37B_19130 [Ilumatobacter sp.]|jgi:hypothetical protein|uniref:hypothetical protein n=1 Tax=Ilumatobacter sp. TaxID=1967498 RepID=UPI003919CBAE